MLWAVSGHEQSFSLEVNEDKLVRKIFSYNFSNRDNFLRTNIKLVNLFNICLQVQ